MKFDVKRDMKNIIVLCLASLLMAINIKTFVRTADLFPGGATGVTILIQRIAQETFLVDLPYTMINFW